MTEWTEEAIRRNLDGHLYRLDMTELGRHVVTDLIPQPVAPKPPAPPRPWTEAELRRLLFLKEAGVKNDAVAVELERNASTVNSKWQTRETWIHKLPRLIEDKPQPITIERIFAQVCKTLKVDPLHVASPRRAVALCEARQIIYWICAHYTGRSYSMIGARLSRDHSTVMHGAKKIEKRFDAYRERVALCLYDLGLEFKAKEAA
jgi:hypothetical protein